MGFKPVTMSGMADAVRSRQLGRGTIAITFDDGYRDNLEAARPILERYETPATHFATAGYIGSEDPFWWDVIDCIFLRTGRLPDSLEITTGGEHHQWALDGDSVLKEGDETRWPDWKPFGPSPTRRHEIHDALWKLLVGAWPDERQRIVRQLIEWAALPPEAGAAMRPLSEDQLRALRGDGLVEIGAHSMTHPALSALPPPMQAHELGGSKARLEEILGAKIGGCSYPQGRSSPEVQQLAREAGYEFACGSVVGAVDSRSNLFHLPRASVRDWGEARFRALLNYHIAA
jgi:peptidoglycan/xylan/chitin deacetylase (PgdA/CDA1 family)